jgi:hypothetical protein
MGMSGSDALYHRLFSHPLMAEQLVREFVPEAMAVGLDFARMERVNAKFHDRDGKRREGDVIWRIPTADGEDVVLHILCEFQSSIDWWMAVRTQVYEGLLWQHLIAERKLKSGDRLPPVLTLVLIQRRTTVARPDRHRSIDHLARRVATVALATVRPLPSPRHGRGAGRGTGDPRQPGSIAVPA